LSRGARILTDNLFRKMLTITGNGWVGIALPCNQFPVFCLFKLFHSFISGKILLRCHPIAPCRANPSPRLILLSTIGNEEREVSKRGRHDGKKRSSLFSCQVILQLSSRIGYQLNKRTHSPQSFAVAKKYPTNSSVSPSRDIQNKLAQLDDRNKYQHWEPTPYKARKRN
jgi:hypothetical protein